MKRERVSHYAFVCRACSIAFPVVCRFKFVFFKRWKTSARVIRWKLDFHFWKLRIQHILQTETCSFPTVWKKQDIFKERASPLEQSDPEGGQVRRSEGGPQAFPLLLTPAIKATCIRFPTCGLLTFAGLFIHFSWLVNCCDAAFMGRSFIINRFHSGVRCLLP